MRLISQFGYICSPVLFSLTFDCRGALILLEIWPVRHVVAGARRGSLRAGGPGVVSRDCAPLRWASAPRITRVGHVPPGVGVVVPSLRSLRGVSSAAAALALSASAPPLRWASPLVGPPPGLFLGLGFLGPPAFPAFVPSPRGRGLSSAFPRPRPRRPAAVTAPRAPRVHPAPRSPISRKAFLLSSPLLASRHVRVPRARGLRGRGRRSDP